MDNTQNSCYTRRKRVPFEELTLADDFLFCKVMQNKRLCKELLEIILHVRIDKIEYTESQKVFDDVIDEKSIRMDVYVKDDKHTIYDIEMQTSNTKELPKRSRYYHSCIDKSQIAKGEPYSKLRKTYVIFICTFDLFDRNFAKYEFDTICKQDKGLILPDDRHTVFVNAQGVTNDQKLKEFLDFLRDGEVSKSPFILDLRREVNYGSKNSKWREEYDMLLAREQLLIEEGRAEGIAEGRKEGLAQGLAQGAEKQKQNTVFFIKEMQKKGLSAEEILASLSGDELKQS